MPKLRGECYPSNQELDKNVDKHLAFRRMKYTILAAPFQEVCMQQTERIGEKRCLECMLSRAKLKHQGYFTCQIYSRYCNISSRARHNLQ